MAKAHRPFDITAFLDSVGVVKHLVEYGRGATIFTQGAVCENVWHIKSGTVKLSVMSAVGKEAVVAMLGPGDFLGETMRSRASRLSGERDGDHAERTGDDREAADVRVAARHHAMSDRFIAHLLARNLRVEQDLVDHLFNSSESDWRGPCYCWRAKYEDISERVVPHISQETLAPMIGTTRSRVNFFLEKVQETWLC